MSLLYTVKKWFRTSDDRDVDPAKVDRPGRQFGDAPGWQLDLRKDDQAVEFWRRALTAHAEIIRDWSQQASLNMAWAAGHQYTNWDRDAGKVIRDPTLDTFNDERAIPIWTNWMRRYAIARIVRVIGAQYTWTARPRSPDAADVASGDTLGKLLPYWWKTLAVDDQDNLLLAWWYLFCTGVVYANPTWDDDADDQEIIPASEWRADLAKFEAELSDQERENSDVEAMFFAQEWGVSREEVEVLPDNSIRVDKSKLKLDWLSGFDVIEDLSVRAWKHKQWVALRYTLPVVEVREQYGDAARHVQGRKQGDSDSDWLMANKIDQVDAAASNIFEQTDVWVIWHRRTRRYPQGLKIEICEDRVLNNDDNPNINLDLPVIPIYEQPDPYKHRPSCTMDDLFILNRAYNKLDVQITKHIDDTVEPNWLARSGSVDPRTFMVESPKTHFWKGDVPPQPVPPEQLAQHVLVQKQMIESQLQDLAGLTNPAMGTPDASVKSGRGILALNERSDMLLNLAVRNMENGLVKIGEACIALYAEHGKDKQTVAITGQDGKREAITFSGKSFLAKSQNAGQPGVQKFDIDVEIGIKPSRASLLAEVDWMLERGLAHPQIHREEIAAAISKGTMAGFDPTKYDRINAAEENEYVKAWSDVVTSEELEFAEVTELFSQFVRVKIGDNPVTHTKSHEMLLKQLGRQMEPRVVGLLEQHIMEHYRVIQESQQAFGNGQEQGQGQQLRQGPMGGGNGAAVSNQEIAKFGGR